MNASDRLRFEERVCAEASARLSARLKELGDASPVVRVLVRTASPLSPVGCSSVRTALDRVARQRGAVVQVHFEVVVGAAADFDDGYAVDCAPVTGVAPPSAPAGQPRQETRARLLTFAYGALRFDYVVEDPTPAWLPLAREIRRGGEAGLALPQSLAVVPAGPLLELGVAHDVLFLRRAAFRPEVGVTVNGVYLQPATVDGVPVDHSGVLRYQHPGGSCVLEYELEDWVPGSPSASGLPDVGDGATHDVALTVGTDTHWLRIDPPPADVRPEERFFPIQDAYERRNLGLEAHVLYTRGRWENARGDEWHVKIYRCATPQHAERLRGYLRTQAALVDTANAAVGGTAQSPPWAVAPVTLLSPGNHHGPPRPTAMSTPERKVMGDPENRLSAWFGVPAQPQPNCFVIAVSPMLRKVGWGDSAIRRDAPGLDQLADLVSLATGLDRCHDLGIAHCDVKPENVCRHQRAGAGTGYVLIDSDAVSRVLAKLVDVRLTKRYASPRILTRWRRSYDGQTLADLREHDRFGFALIVLAAVAGIDRVASLLRAQDDGQRPVDRPGVVADAIRTWWPSDTYGRFAEVLAQPFAPDVLLRDDWRAVGWLTELRDAGAARPPDPATEPPPRRYLGKHSHHLAGIRDQVRATALGRNRVVPEVMARLAERQRVVARAECRRIVLLGGVLPVLVMALALVAVVVNG